MTGPVKIIAISLSLFLCSPAFAEIYKYRDDSGRLVFVDDKDKVPARYQEETSSIPEPDSTLGYYNSPQVLPDEDQPDISLIEDDLETDLYQRKRDEEKYQTPVAVVGNRVLVPVEVSIGQRSASLNLLLDTGATSTVFHRRALTNLELPKGRIYKARVAGGSVVKSRKMKFSTFTVGPFQVEDKRAMVISLKGDNLPYDGMLGMDFLRNHPYQVDYDKQIIQWQVP